MYKVIVQYGAETHTHTASIQPTVGTVLGNSTVRAVLGFGDNVKGLVGGVEQTTDTPLPDGAVLRVETKANQKAV